MADWIYDALESFQTFMEQGTFTDLLLTLAVSALGGLAIVAIHEAGHALAALLTGNRVRELRVGDADDVTVTAGAFRLRLGRLRGDGDVGGYVIWEARSATPQQILLIALAGPAANVLTAALCAVLAARSGGMLAVVLALCAVTSLLSAVVNLRPTGDPAHPAGWSDGRWAQAAWAARSREHPDR